MARFATPVSFYMSFPVATVQPDDDLDLVQRQLAAVNVSALGVTDSRGHLIGVISRTDLLHLGRRQAGQRRQAAVLTLPRKTVSEVMESDVISVAPESTVGEASALMVRHRVHRVFVVSEGRLAGVFSTKDVMAAVRDTRITRPIRDYMASSVFSVAFDDPVATAVERLAKAHVSGLVVLEDDWPIGVFTQVEALESKDVPRDTPVEHVLSPAMLCLDVDTALHRAAAHAATMDVRRIIAVRDRRLEGILTGLDFARAASE